MNLWGRMLFWTSFERLKQRGNAVVTDSIRIAPKLCLIFIHEAVRSVIIMKKLTIWEKRLVIAILWLTQNFLIYRDSDCQPRNLTLERDAGDFMQHSGQWRSQRIDPYPVKYAIASALFPTISGLSGKPGRIYLQNPEIQGLGWPDGGYQSMWFETKPGARWSKCGWSGWQLSAS